MPGHLGKSVSTHDPSHTGPNKHGNIPLERIRSASMQYTGTIAHRKRHCTARPAICVDRQCDRHRVS